MTSWILAEKEKLPSVWQQFFFGWYQLGIHNIIQYNLIGTGSNVIHQSYPSHHIRCFQFFRCTLLLCHFLYQIFRHTVNDFGASPRSRMSCTLWPVMPTSWPRLPRIRRTTPTARALKLHLRRCSALALHLFWCLCEKRKRQKERRNTRCHFRKISSGARQPQPIRSRAQCRRMAGDCPSEIPSAIRRAKQRTVIPGISPATATTAGQRILPCWKRCTWRHTPAVCCCSTSAISRQILFLFKPGLAM